MGQYLKPDPRWGHEKKMAYYRDIMRGQRIVGAAIGVAFILIIIILLLVKLF